MNYTTIHGGKIPIKAWIHGVDIEKQAIEQLINLSNVEGLYSHIAVMPDVHWGNGSTVGSVFASPDIIIPAAVGVDIGCGMRAIPLNLKLAELKKLGLANIREKIESVVPHGRTNDGGVGDRGSWGTVPDYIQDSFDHRLKPGLESIVKKHPKLEKAANRAPYHLGTLGTGNHFIELCVEKDSDDIWLVLHSGSRGIGNRIGSYFSELAKNECLEYNRVIPDSNLSYFPYSSHLFNDYWSALDWAQSYAKLNRYWMMENIVTLIEKMTQRLILNYMRVIDCHHNYVQLRKFDNQLVYITRKGAVNADHYELGIIPGSMGARTYIVEGKGNPDSFFSCSHGAGRLMSRGAAKKKFTLEDHIQATEGVECRKDLNVIDETPKAYKDIDSVMQAQNDLVTIKHTLKQIICVKG